VSGEKRGCKNSECKIHKAPPTHARTHAPAQSRSPSTAAPSAGSRGGWRCAGGPPIWAQSPKPGHASAPVGVRVICDLWWAIITGRVKRCCWDGLVDDPKPGLPQGSADRLILTQIKLNQRTRMAVAFSSRASSRFRTSAGSSLAAAPAAAPCAAAAPPSTPAVVMAGASFASPLSPAAAPEAGPAAAAFAAAGGAAAAATSVAILVCCCCWCCCLGARHLTAQTNQ